MTKPFLVVQVTDGELGQIKERATFDEAVEIGTQLALEQSDESATTIRQEFETDLNWQSPNGDITIYLAQSDDD